MSVGELIKSQRIAYGLTQAELGDRLGVGKRRIEKWESGYVADIPLSKVQTMAKLFGITTSWLINDEIVDSCNLYDDCDKA